MGYQSQLDRGELSKRLPGRVGAGSATPSGDAILPVAVPIVFPVVAKMLPLVSGSMSLLALLSLGAC